MVDVHYSSCSSFTPFHRSSIQRILYRSMTDWMHLDSQNHQTHVLCPSTVLGSSKRFQIIPTMKRRSGSRLSGATSWSLLTTCAISSMLSFHSRWLNHRHLLFRTFFPIMKAGHLRSFSWHTPTFNLLGSFPHLVDVNISTMAYYQTVPTLEVVLPRLRKFAGDFGALQIITSWNRNIQDLVWRISAPETVCSPDLPLFLQLMPCNRYLISLVIHDGYLPSNIQF